MALTVRLSILIFEEIDWSMKLIKRISMVFICMIFSACFLIVMMMIFAVLRYPDGQSEYEIMNYLLSRVTIQTAVGEDVWAAKYPYDNAIIEKWESKFMKIEKTVNSFCTVSFPFGEGINTVLNYFEKNILHYNISEISGIYENQRYVEDAAENVIELKETVNEMEIPFLYVQTPSAGSISYYQGNVVEGDSLMIAERSYCLMKILEENEVDFINIARDYPDGITFDSSGHWMPDDGCRCASIIAEEMKNKFGFDLELNIFNENNFVDLMDDYTEERDEIKKNRGYDFYVPVSKYDGDYSLIYAEASSWNGSFNDTMFKEREEWMLDKGPYHNIFRITNTSIYEIRNNNAENDIKILVIGDSFNWPVSTYLSLAVKDVIVIHNAGFTGSIVSYIEQKKPDMVFMVYNDAEFWEVYTEEAYYLK